MLKKQVIVFFISVKLRRQRYDFFVFFCTFATSFFRCMKQEKIPVRLYSEIGRLNAVLLHKPGPEIEAMTPLNAHHALYQDILNKDIVDEEYRLFSGVLSKCTKTYQVRDLLAEVLADSSVADDLVRRSCLSDGCEYLIPELLAQKPDQLAQTLIEGFSYRKGKDNPCFEEGRYVLQPLYNLFFTRDASSCVFDRALINTMSFQVRAREAFIYKTIFEKFFGAETFRAADMSVEAHTEGGDVQIVRDDLLCVGCGVRTNAKGIEYLLKAHAHKPRFTVIAQELPLEPDSFIHLDMVFTFLGPHTCMAFEPMVKKTGLFAGKSTVAYTIENGVITKKEYPEILTALRTQGVDLQPVFCGGDDEWTQLREQWHSGANFFALGPDHVIGYRRNRRTIEALDKASFTVLTAEEVVDGGANPFDYEKCVVTFAGSELPRGGGGARCMTCPVNRDEVDYNVL